MTRDSDAGVSPVDLSRSSVGIATRTSMTRSRAAQSHALALREIVERERDRTAGERHVVLDAHARDLRAETAKSQPQ
jgi:hypothetical protein